MNTLLASRVIGCVFALLTSIAMAETVNWSFTNPAGRYTDELLRVPVKLAVPYDSTKLVVTEDGREVAYQVEVLEGKPDAVIRGDIWVCTNVDKGSSRTYTVTTGGTPATFAGKVSLKTEGDDFVLDNGIIGVKVPVKGAAMRGPILGVRIKGGNWLGKSTWKKDTALVLQGGTIVSSGPLFAKVRVTYTSGVANESNLVVADATFTVKPGQSVVHIEETHSMGEKDYWEFDITKGWQAKQCTMRVNNEGYGAGAGNSFPKDKWPVTLVAGQTRMGDTHLFLLPRWSQAFDDGWFFAAHDGTNLVGAIPARAGRWVWPHDNKIEVKVKASGDYAGLRCPTFRGSRYWLLLAGPASLGAAAGRADGARDVVVSATMQNLDKIINEYISSWPGQKGGFQGAFFFDNGTNPTGQRRPMAKAALSSAGRPGDLTTLFWAQVNLDPDWYGSYYTYWSPENPNFFTDFIRLPITTVTQLKAHPEFAKLRQMAEDKLREDMDHSVTLPGGAGQECPGYLAHGLGGWAELASVCREHLGFDPQTWPRYKAAQSFLDRISYPDGGRRRFNPAGDSHPDRAGGSGMRTVNAGDVSGWVTEELPGFGAVFRNNPGTPKETFLAFKSGPNRGHYHGDQLSFHYCANAKPIAVDHHCSYNPRAGQEHMHNRVAFSLPQAGFDYANIDGYERLIAFKTGKDVDIAVGQVESPRLRKVVKLPPESWDDRWGIHEFKSPIVYRRTMVQVKNAGADYFVIRDQYSCEGETGLAATWNLHAYTETVERKGANISCGKLSVFVAQPAEFAFESFAWEHNNGGNEKTTGPRLTVKGAAGEFITVLYPSNKPPKMQAVPGGVKVGDDEIVFAGDLVESEDKRKNMGVAVTVTRAGQPIAKLEAGDIDLNRSQGEVGLFVPDAGYPFGPVPEWLIQQRSKLTKKK